MLGAGARVVDLSGAFRLRTVENYLAWYKEPHTQPELLAEAVYGLPEFCRERIPGARLVSNPGCYPTAANLAIRPLSKRGWSIAPRGSSATPSPASAGRAASRSLKTSFCEVTENFSAYSILQTPPRAGSAPDLRPRGARVQLHRAIAAARPRHPRDDLLPRRRALPAAEELLAIYEKRYADEPFVRLYNPGHTCPTCAASREPISATSASPWIPPPGARVVVSAIDNLVKGAAGQAVQNMNLMLGFAETEGLL